MAWEEPLTDGLTAARRRGPTVGGRPVRVQRRGAPTWRGSAAVDTLTLAGQQRLLTLAGRVFAALYGLGALLFTLTLLAVARYPIWPGSTTTATAAAIMGPIPL